MFPKRYFTRRFWAERFWPPVVVSGPVWGTICETTLIGQTINRTLSATWERTTLEGPVLNRTLTHTCEGDE